MARWASLLGAGVLVMLGGLGGCASRAAPTTELALAPGEYPAAFRAAQRVLRESDFVLERLDAALGVITTRPKETAGLATPRDQEQTDAGQEFDDLLNRQSRQVRVTFEPVGGRAVPDLRDDAGALVARARVTVIRRQRPGWRLEPSSVRLSGHSSDGLLADRGLEPEYTVATTTDPVLAGRILDAIRAAIREPSETPEATSP